MKQLREKIESVISLWWLNGSEFPGELAERILDIPEIKEALSLSKRYFERDGQIGERL